MVKIDLQTYLTFSHALFIGSKLQIYQKGYRIFLDIIWFLWRHSILLKAVAILIESIFVNIYFWGTHSQVSVWLALWLLPRTLHSPKTWWQNSLLRGYCAHSTLFACSNIDRVFTLARLVLPDLTLKPFMLTPTLWNSRQTAWTFIFWIIQVGMQLGNFDSSRSILIDCLHFPFDSFHMPISQPKLKANQTSPSQGTATIAASEQLSPLGRQIELVSAHE